MLKKKNEKWCETTYFNCCCFTPEHLIRFFENKEDETISIEMLLLFTDNVFKRTYKSIKYVFGGMVCYKDMFVFNRKEIRELKKIVNKHCKEKPCKNLDSVVLCENDEHYLFLELVEVFDGVFELCFDIVFKKVGLRERLKKAWRHIGGTGCRYGLWDEWELDGESLVKLKSLVYLFERKLKEEEKREKEKEKN